MQDVKTLWADFARPIVMAVDYIASLRERRMNVFSMGKRVPEPVDNPVIFPSINAMAETYRLASEQPELASVRTEIGACQTNRFLHVPTKPENLVAKHEMQRELGRRTGTCFQRCVGLNFGFIGCGCVGRTLAQAFSKAGYNVTAAWSRTAADAELMARDVSRLRAVPSAQAVADACDFVWVTVSDDAIAEVANSINWNPRHKVVHCSGATEIESLAKARKDGAAIGGFHPLQMFTNPTVALQGLPGSTVGIEADPALLEVLKQVAADIGCVTVQVPPGDRALYHASAYYVGPFFIALLSEAVTLWKKFGATEKEALNALLPLLAGTTSALIDGSLAQGMGGCVARGDVGTVHRHVAAVDKFDADAGRLYRALASRTIPLGLTRGSLSASAAEQISKALAVAEKVEA